MHEALFRHTASRPFVGNFLQFLFWVMSFVRTDMIQQKVLNMQNYPRQGRGGGAAA